MAGRIPKQISGVLVQAAGDEWVAYVQESNNAHALNRSAGQLWAAIDGVANVKDLAERLDLTVDVVLWGLNELAEAELITFTNELDDTAKNVLDEVCVDRRALLIKLGIGSAAAAALPVVETIVAPTRAAAASASAPTPIPTEFPTPAPTPFPTMATPAPSPCGCAIVFGAPFGAPGERKVPMDVVFSGACFEIFVSLAVNGVGVGNTDENPEVFSNQSVDIIDGRATVLVFGNLECEATFVDAE